MVVLTAPALVLDSQDLDAIETLQEIWKQPSYFLQKIDKKSKFIYVESWNIYTNEITSHVKGNRPSYY